MSNVELTANIIASKTIRNLKVAMPAIVVSIDEIKDGFVNVKPIVNYQNKQTLECYEYGDIQRVKVQYPSTKTSSITIPVSLGDIVELIFQSVGIQDILNGNTTPHDPIMHIFNNMVDCVAFIGFEPFQKSCMNPNNYSNDFNNQDLNIVHNKNTDREVTFSLTQDGGVKVISSGEVSIKCNTATVDATEIDAVNSLVKTNNDVEIKGVSVYQHMTTHVHSGVQSGNSKTLVPDPI